MPNIQSAKKRVRQTITRRARNMSQRSSMRTAVKSLEASLEAGDKDAATKAYKDAARALDKAVTKGLIHKNNAARKKSRMNARVKAL